MSVHSRSTRVTTASVVAQKSRGERITMLTAYDFHSARLLDEAGVDILLVGDSLANVVLGHETTLPVTMDEMIHHTRAVARGTKRALVVGDMPWLSYHVSWEEGVRNAGRFVKEGGAAAVKLEGGRRRIPVIRAILDAEIPVMGHVGLTPQSIHRIGGYKVQGKTAEEADRLLDDAQALEAAGVFAVVLECVPAEVAARITAALSVPTIGIGAGPGCDGQVLVYHDYLGLTPQAPRFVRRYADLQGTIREATERLLADIRSGAFPDESESYRLPSEAAVPVRRRTGEPGQ